VHAHLALPEMEDGLLGLIVMGLGAAAFALALIFVCVAWRELREHLRARRGRAQAHAAYPRGAAAPGRARPADAKAVHNSPAAAPRVQRRP
jgi:hypothetical protein